MTKSKGKSKKTTARELAPTRTAQHCAQCTAHGKISLLKGHKKHCPFKECQCVHCILVNNKRQIMAKQVKLKRLQEKNHARLRAAKKALPYQAIGDDDSLSDQNSDLLGLKITDIQHYQDDACYAICGLKNDTIPNHLPPNYVPFDQWCPSMLPFTQFNPLQQLQSTSTSALFPPCCPGMATTPLSFFTTPIGEAEATSINHVLTQPVFCPPPIFGQNMLFASPFPALLPEENTLKPVEVDSDDESGTMPSIDAAKALLTLQTGEE